MRKLKYFIENKEDITKVADMNILDVKYSTSSMDLKDYANKGRSKVLRINS